MANLVSKWTEAIFINPTASYSPKIKLTCKQITPASNCLRVKRTIRSGGYFHLSVISIYFYFFLERIIFLVAKKPS